LSRIVGRLRPVNKCPESGPVGFLGKPEELRRFSAAPRNILEGRQSVPRGTFTCRCRTEKK
jgi:hypothetical protein